MSKHLSPFYRYFSNINISFNTSVIDQIKNIENSATIILLTLTQN